MCEQVLGLENGCQEPEIRAAYKKLAAQERPFAFHSTHQDVLLTCNLQALA